MVISTVPVPMSQVKTLYSEFDDVKKTSSDAKAKLKEIDAKKQQQKKSQQQQQQQQQLKGEKTKRKGQQTQVPGCCHEQGKLVHTFDSSEVTLRLQQNFNTKFMLVSMI